MLATAARRAAFEGTEAASAPARDRAQRGAASALGASRLERHAPSARGAGALQDGASVVLCPNGCGASNEQTAKPSVLAAAVLSVERHEVLTQNTDRAHTPRTKRELCCTERVVYRVVHS